MFKINFFVSEMITESETLMLPEAFLVSETLVMSEAFMMPETLVVSDTLVVPDTPVMFETFVISKAPAENISRLLPLESDPCYLQNQAPEDPRQIQKPDDSDIFKQIIICFKEDKHTDAGSDKQSCHHLGRRDQIAQVHLG